MSDRREPRARIVRSVCIAATAAVASITVNCSGGETEPQANGTVVSISVSPVTAAVPLLGTVQLTATLRDAQGLAVTGHQVTWTSSDVSVATVSTSGLVRGVSSGAAAITATSDGSSGVAAITVSFVLAAIRAGNVYSCGVTPTGAAFCWGYNSFGVLGDGTTTNHFTPNPVAGGLSFSDVIPTAFRTCGLSNGSAYCWGVNGQGQLGDGTTVDRLTPTPVSGGLVFTQLSANDLHACGVVASGAAFCWGTNDFGQLGDGTTISRITPVPVTGGRIFSAISVGYNHTCGLVAGGAAYCWGKNSVGQLGDGTTTTRPVPAAVTGGMSFRVLTGSGFSTCGVVSSGAAYCWGVNDGKFGDGTYVNKSTPTPVAGGLTFADISPGGAHTCGVTSSGAAYCWGHGSSGALGDGSFSMNDRLVPVAVAGGLSFAKVVAGGFHTCGITAAGVPYCWGYDGGGLGTLTGNVAVPTRVRDP